MSKTELELSAKEIDFLLSPLAIRERARAIFARTQQGLGAFRYHPEKMDATVEIVLAVIRQKYPDLKIPFHSRWGHFRVGGVDRVALLDAQLKSLLPLERARTKLDLVITSVLLDAGAGTQWKYLESGQKVPIARSEGLGVASLNMFMSGAMSSDPKELRADADGLRGVTQEALEKHFQVSSTNPLLGVSGRLSLLRNLAGAVSDPKRFRDGRPGNILDFLIHQYGEHIPATGLLRAVLDGFGSIWPGRLAVAGGRNLGDVWRHSQLGASAFASLVPFHKLSQWMTYSLIEPIEEAGVKVTGVEELTGLAEYRNGGLLLDSGLISLANPEDSQKQWPPDSDLIIEWRALTIDRLDQIGEAVRHKLGKTAQEFPLAKVLEGGTWWAGRKLAAQARADGSPPLQIQSDGTVF